jgi:hypothetical protein
MRSRRFRRRSLTRSVIRSLTLAFWMEDTGAYADAAGREVRRPAAGGHGAAVEVELRGADRRDRLRRRAAR